MTSYNLTGDRDVFSDVGDAHQYAVAALDDPEANSLAAVTWASAHLAAVERVLYPLAARTLPEGQDRVRAQVAVDHRLQQALWRLDRRLTGDVHLARLPVRELEDGVRRRLREHADGEQSLLADLWKVLDPEQRRGLRERLAAAVQHAPTRPHPDTRHGHLEGGLPFWFEAVIDRIRDGLDSRDVPTPHRIPAPRPLGRWGAYLLGVPYERAKGRSARRKGRRRL